MNKMNKMNKMNTIAILMIGMTMITACNEQTLTVQNNSDDSFITLSNNSDVILGFTLATFWNPGPENIGNAHYYVSSKNDDGHLLVATVNGEKPLMAVQTLDNSVEYRSQKLQLVEFFGSTNKISIQNNDEVGLISDVEVTLNFPSSLEVESMSEISKSGNKTIRWKKLLTDEDLVCRISYNALSNGAKTVKNFIVSGRDGEFNIPMSVLDECQINDKLDIQLGRWNETNFKSGVSGSVYSISYTQGKFKVVE